MPDNVALSENWVVEDPKKKVNWFDLFNPRHLKIIETNALNDYEQHFESKSHQNYMCNHPTKGPFIFSIAEVKETIEARHPSLSTAVSDMCSGRGAQGEGWALYALQEAQGSAANRLSVSATNSRGTRTSSPFFLILFSQGDRRFFLETKTFPKSTKTLKTAVAEHEVSSFCGTPRRADPFRRGSRRAS